MENKSLNGVMIKEIENNLQCRQEIKLYSFSMTKFLDSDVPKFIPNVFMQIITLYNNSF